ncbi:MAG: potassium channel family protein [Eubacteriaceae bacterium]
MFFKKTESVIIAGCGRLSAKIAGELSSKGYNVTVVDKDENAFRKLPEHFSGYEIAGDATDIDALVQIGIKGASMFLALTENDNTNSLLSQIASRIFGVSKVFVRLNDPDKERILEGFNIEIIYPFKLSIGEFERLSHLSLSEVSK